MEKENFVRSIEVIGTALALTLAVSIIAPAQDASANDTSPRIDEIEPLPTSLANHTIAL